MLWSMPLIAAEPQIRSVNAALLGGAVVAAGSAATNYLTGFRCPVYEFAGCWCAFCGATRAVGQLLRGDPEVALRNNGLIVLTLGAVIVRSALQLLGGRRLVASADGLLERVDIRAWAALVLVWTLLRNLPWLEFLAPAA